MNPIIQTEAAQIATLTLNRPERHNALDEKSIAQLHDAISALQTRTDIRAIVIAANGKSFCAGADLEWMKRAAQLDKAENFKDARALAALLHAISTSSKPVVARIQGAAYGGGVGLIAACDIALASSHARFALTEVRLGLVAATISPYVLRALGERQMLRYLLTAQPFDAAHAKELGLIHECVADDRLDVTLSEILTALKQGAPIAQARCKELIRNVAYQPLDDKMIDWCAQFLADIRTSDEAREGIQAFLVKQNLQK